jgi:orotate phosphoribosyltransferase
MNLPHVTDLAAHRVALKELLATRAFERRRVTLASGRLSNFYLDCKQVTLDAFGHVLVGRLLFAALAEHERQGGGKIVGVGGLTLGADPIASAVSLISALEGAPVPAFIVRKEPKGHGTGAYLEGARNLVPGGELAVVEDVVTTGDSALKAVRRVREAGFRVGLVLGLVDRLEGGREAIEAEQLRLVTLFSRRDFLSDAEAEVEPAVGGGG